MAEYLGFSFGHFSSICNGKVKVSEQFRKKITSELGINWDYILTGNGEILLSAPAGNVAQVGEGSNGGNIGVNGNGNNYGDIGTAPVPDPSVSALTDTIKQLADTNQQQAATLAELVKTNAQLVAMLAKQQTNKDNE